MPHTPGPWILRPAKKEARAQIDTETDNSILDLRACSAQGRVEFTDNARLIAAAPDLLAVLREGVNGAIKADSPDWWGRVYAAVAKAEGR